MGREARAIYAALRGYEGQVNIGVEGVAASAASLIVMAGETITMTPGAFLMIHDPASWYVDGRGTEDDHLKAAKSLGVIANAYAGIYAKRAGLSVEGARAIMKEETYYDPQGALDSGFATDPDDDSDEAEPAAFDYRIYQHAPERLLTAAGAIQRQRPTAEVFAMMTGTTPKSSKPKPARGTKAMANTKPAPRGRITGAKPKAEGDVYFDLVLRQMEDEHAQHMRAAGQVHPDGRTRIQIQLTRYWIVSVGEMLRATRNRTEKGSELCQKMTDLVNRFGAVRMMIAKQDVQKHREPRPETIGAGVLVEADDGTYQMSCERVGLQGAYQVAPIMNRENGSICLPVYDAAGQVLRVDDRRTLSDLLLSEFS
ncbi:Clp protease ClpP [Pseudomonas sp. GX19020]|uniref:Clp protease ClpP n=1 Tax=Pseudomonas sp. GX19020 TaxID=2942277 RepID=UPI0020191751|nr:Clp protease ClpP [Pseudomonas sp. GX19020]MCL4066830.1 Clp protease ClpP [Pseudomonas sp. GX19020]